jgi:hypothetical protein
MGFRTIMLLLLALAFMIIIMIVYGRIHWRNRTQALHQRLTAERQPVQPIVYDPNELANLPAPVQRYLQTVLTPGQPMIESLQMRHSGQFSLSETVPKWVPFTSEQVTQMRRIGFDWVSYIKMAPRIPCFVHDAYINGAGLLHATAFGLVTLAKMQDTPEVNQGELLRFLAEAAWYPTMLLPSQGVVWKAIDDHCASATLTDNGTTVTLEFRFGDDHLIQSVYAAKRYRTVHGQLVTTPWQGRFWNYEKRSDILIPIAGEVAWLLPDQALPYWRGQLETITYECSCLFPSERMTSRKKPF